MFVLTYLINLSVSVWASTTELINFPIWSWFLVLAPHVITWVFGPVVPALAPASQCWSECFYWCCLFSVLSLSDPLTVKLNWKQLSKTPPKNLRNDLNQIQFGICKQGLCLPSGAEGWNIFVLNWPPLSAVMWTTAPTLSSPRRAVMRASGVSVVLLKPLVLISSHALSHTNTYPPTLPHDMSAPPTRGSQSRCLLHAPCPVINVENLIALVSGWSYQRGMNEITSDAAPLCLILNQITVCNLSSCELTWVQRKSPHIPLSLLSSNSYEVGFFSHPGSYFWTFIRTV